MSKPEAVTPANQQRKLVLQEVLSKPGAETLPLAEQEFYELCIEESDDVFRPGFVVKQTRAQWSEIDRQVMWEEPKWERWPTLKKAKEKCEEWKKALASTDAQACASCSSTSSRGMASVEQIISYT